MSPVELSGGRWRHSKHRPVIDLFINVSAPVRSGQNFLALVQGSQPRGVLEPRPVCLADRLQSANLMLPTHFVTNRHEDTVDSGKSHMLNVASFYVLLLLLVAKIQNAHFLMHLADNQVLVEDKV